MTLRRNLRFTIWSALTLAAATASAGAQASDSLRERYLLPRPVVKTSSTLLAQGIPGITVQVPSGFGAEAGDIFAGVAYQQRTRFVTPQADGAVAAGFGIGNARDYVGLETTVTSYSTINSGFGNHMAVSFKVSRLLSDDLGVAVGWENAFHSTGTDGGKSIFAAASRMITLRDDPDAPFNELALTAGVGSNRFQSQAAEAAGDNGVGGFGSVAVRVFRPVSAIADWSGQNLTLAASIAPFSRFPLVITPAVTDITNNSGDGSRFILSAGVAANIPLLRGLLGGTR